MSHPFGKLGLFIMPVFKNGKVLRLTIPRWVAKNLRLSPGDLVVWRMNAAGEITVAKFDVTRLRDEHIQGRTAELTLGSGGAVAPRDGAREP